jgi:tetratricopeptide (TPR) repeat protein
VNLDFADVGTLLLSAKTLEAAERHADASEQYDRALRANNGDEEQRLRTQCDLGHCLIMSGRHAEALANVGEAYASGLGNSDTLIHVFRAFYLQMESLYRLHEIHNGDSEAGLTRLKSLLEEGLVWLVDINRPGWRCTLLFLKAKILWKLGQRARAFELSEIAFREKEQTDCPGFFVVDHAPQVAKHARLLGYRERALEILTRYEHETLSGISRIRLLAERVRLLEELDPPQISAALDEARRMPALSKEIHRSRDQLIAYGELAVAATLAESFSESYDALERAVDIALNDQTLDKTWLLRKSRSYSRESYDIMKTKPSGSATAAVNYVRKFLAQIDEALCACQAVN